MALPTLTKTWNFDVNNYYPPTNDNTLAHRNLLFKIKSSLENLGGWSVVASSNGSVANTNDNWDSITSLNWTGGLSGGANGPRSWIILKHPINNSQILFNLTSGIYSGCIGSNCLPIGYATIQFSRQGWNTSSAFSTSSPPSSNVSGDVFTLVDGEAPTSIAWGLSLTNPSFVHHYMYSSDGYCHRTIIYCQDVPVFMLFLDTPESAAAQWNPFGLPSYAMFANAAGTINNVSTIANFYTGANARTRIGPVGSYPDANVSAFLSAEAYNNSLLVNGLQIPNDLTGEYPMLEIGLSSNTSPYLGKIGKVSDLWFGVPNILGSPSYPDDGSAQFVQHGCLITPWNGSVMLTR